MNTRSLSKDLVKYFVKSRSLHFDLFWNCFVAAYSYSNLIYCQIPLGEWPSDGGESHKRGYQEIKYETS